MGGDNQGKGGRVFRNNYKGHMDPKGVGLKVGGGDGWDGVQWWGENGNNCTWTTLKISKNK